MEERLQKYMAHCGVASRRKCEELIADGLVAVNGEVVREAGVRIDPARDRVTVDGRRLTAETPAYFVHYKVKGVTTTVSDDLGRRTVMDCLPEMRERVYPVGRLDKESEGLLLLTNDGAMAHYLTHPAFGVEKTYRVVAEGRLPSETIAELAAKGMRLGPVLVKPSRVELVRYDNENTIVLISVAEGINREVRRIFAALGHEVKKLLRVRIGPLGLEGMKRGEIRPLTTRELSLLRKGMAGQPEAAEAEAMFPPGSAKARKPTGPRGRPRRIKAPRRGKPDPAASAASAPRKTGKRGETTVDDWQKHTGPKRPAAGRGAARGARPEGGGAFPARRGPAAGSKGGAKGGFKSGSKSEFRSEFKKEFKKEFKTDFKTDFQGGAKGGSRGGAKDGARAWSKDRPQTRSPRDGEERPRRAAAGERSFAKRPASGQGTSARFGKTAGAKERSAAPEWKAKRTAPARGASGSRDEWDSRDERGSRGGPNSWGLPAPRGVRHPIKDRPPTRSPDDAAEGSRAGEERSFAKRPASAKGKSARFGKTVGAKEWKSSKDWKPKSAASARGASGSRGARDSKDSRDTRGARDTRDARGESDSRAFRQPKGGKSAAGAPKARDNERNARDWSSPKRAAGPNPARNAKGARDGARNDAPNGQRASFAKGGPAAGRPSAGRPASGRPGTPRAKAAFSARPGGKGRPASRPLTGFKKRKDSAR